MSNNYFLGIDTSAYTTSLAIIDEEDNLILDVRKILEVKKGHKGLRQQEAVFQHINNLPILVDKMSSYIDVSKIYTVACSSRPRNIKESYMPVFTVGRGQAIIISKLLNAKYKEFSHQQGHIGVGIMDNKLKGKDRFLCIHISGGTTELLLVRNKKDCLEVDIIGGTLDISIGQLIDRIGVEIGLDFPCGKEMDEISKKGEILNVNIPISIKDDTWFNLSGIENFIKNLIKSHSYNIEDILATLFNAMGNLIYNIIKNGSIQYKLNDVLITGGVVSNRIIRKNLKYNLSKKGIISNFPKPELCTDNSVGIAYLGKTIHI